MIYTLPRMLLALSLAFLLAYFFYRGFLWGLKLYRLNNSAYKKIKKGETFTAENVRSIRPNVGLHTKYFEQVLGQKANSDLKKGTPMDWKYIEFEGD